jgi:hypothetical protein
MLTFGYSEGFVAQYFPKIAAKTAMAATKTQTTA